MRLVDQLQAAGRYEAVWNGTNITGAGVASGIYLYRITSGSGYTETKRMTLLKLAGSVEVFFTITRSCNRLGFNK